jgi:hypothetical protein
MLTVIGSLHFLVRQAAAAANASTGPNCQQAMPEFLGNGVPNGGAHNFIDIGHSSALGSIGLFGQQDHFSNTQQMLSRSYDGEPIARLGMNVGYELGYSSASMGGTTGAPVSGQGSLSVSSFLKPGSADGDEKPSAGQ